MKAQYLLPGFIWLPDKDSGRKAYMLKLDKELKNHFSYVESKQNKQRGYHQGEFSKGSALALYISRYLGDGIYTSDAPDILDMFFEASEAHGRRSDIIYLLIVTDGKIVAGTDIIVKRELFDFFIQQIADTKYSHLNIRAFTTEDLFELNRKYISDMVSENKYSNIMLGLILMIFLILCGGGLAWFILMP
ncbi:hypothetical protein HKU92_004379 [Salmonella enterica subsp. enterica serovar Leeuwarden]|nr:hypothetical protein [Salmonella enterica subsp. enterica]EDV5118946.1 hypothetical protein [Salmonella enterica subsp. enterica]EEA7624581.1 hypothetical protein [Salmonella enterica]EGH9459468.1 hypothetical protein [Salmonella enterica subsp. enterica serovar Leeuwarden]EGH9460307.1 hypothetical protein [Salmonella enterica subsp. enterica serovar Leeuwarden]